MMLLLTAESVLLLTAPLAVPSLLWAPLLAGACKCPAASAKLDGTAGALAGGAPLLLLGPAPPLCADGASSKLLLKAGCSSKLVQARPESTAVASVAACSSQAGHQQATAKREWT